MNQVFCKNLAIATLLLVSHVSAESGNEENHYRWLDSRGEPVYSDQPPPSGIDYEVVSTQSTLKRVVSKEEGAVPREVQPSVTNDFDPVDVAEEGDEDKNPVLCEKAEANLIALQSDRDLNIRNDKGDVKVLTPEERELAIQNANHQISTYCD